MEEASIEEAMVRKYARAVGCISYYFQSPKGWLQPEVEYVYDMCVPRGEVALKPLDGEVESFQVCLSFDWHPLCPHTLILLCSCSH